MSRSCHAVQCPVMTISCSHVASCTVSMYCDILQSEVIPLYNGDAKRCDCLGCAKWDMWCDISGCDVMGLIQVRERHMMSYHLFWFDTNSVTWHTVCSISCTNTLNQNVIVYSVQQCRILQIPDSVVFHRVVLHADVLHLLCVGREYCRESAVIMFLSDTVAEKLM